MWDSALTESQTSPRHLWVNNDLSDSSLYPFHVDLAMAGALHTAISLSHADFSAILNGSYARNPVVQLSLCQGRSEMEVTERGTIWAESCWQSRP